MEWIETIRYAIEECGITLLDTAPWYGHGTSEMVVGWALEDILIPEANESDEETNTDPRKKKTPMVRREDLCINTKVGRYELDERNQFDFSREVTLSSCERSLRRLSCGYIDVLQLHDPEFAPTLDILLEETIPAMIECRSKGWCRALGLTGYPLEVQYQILRHTLETHGPEERIWDQALTYGHFNLHDSSLVHRRVSPTLESFAAACAQQGMGLLAAAPLSMGLLTHGDPPDWHPGNPELQNACREAARVCFDLGVDLPTLAIVYALSHPSLPCTLLGMKDVREVTTVARLAKRFRSVDWTLPGLTQDLVLSFVLTAKEQRAYQRLTDAEDGPFAGVWKATDKDHYDGSGAFRPKYQWDGIADAHRFWKRQQAAGNPRPVDDWQDKSFP